KNQVAATISVHRAPHHIVVSADGKREFDANSGSNTVSVIDLERRREIGVAATGEQPWMAEVSPDGGTLVVINRAAGSVSVYTISDLTNQPLQFRESFSGCPGASDVVIAPNSNQEVRSGSKAFITCSAGHQVMAIWLAAAADSWTGQQDSSLQHDHMLTLL